MATTRIFLALLLSIHCAWFAGCGASIIDNRNRRLLIIPGAAIGAQQQEQEQGEIYYGRDAEGGKSMKIIQLHQRSQSTSSIAAIALVSDDDILAKSEYDRNGRMIDCELIDNPNDISRFADHVDEEIEKALSSRRRHHHNHNNHKSMTPPEERTTNSDFLVAKYENLFDLDATVKSCRQLLIRERLSASNEGEGEGEDEEEEGGSKRTKRSYLIWPGTNWCGKGSKAEFADSYGPNKETDQCCKKHDQCPYLIEGFTTRYNLFNYRVHTLSHCDCDIPFKACLKSANTSTAAMVGKVYFNVVNTECFVLNLQKTCARRSWWGACEKYTTKWTATVKSLGNFPE